MLRLLAGGLWTTLRHLLESLCITRFVCNFRCECWSLCLILSRIYSISLKFFCSCFSFILNEQCALYRLSVFGISAKWTENTDCCSVYIYRQIRSCLRLVLFLRNFSFFFVSGHKYIIFDPWLFSKRVKIQFFLHKLTHWAMGLASCAFLLGCRNAEICWSKPVIWNWATLWFLWRPSETRINFWAKDLDAFNVNKVLVAWSPLEFGLQIFFPHFKFAKFASFSFCDVLSSVLMFTIPVARWCKRKECKSINSHEKAKGPK